MRFLILASSLVVSILFVSNGRIFTSDVGVIDQYWGVFIGMNTVFVTLTTLFWRQLYLLNKQDKGAEITPHSTLNTPHWKPPPEGGGFCYISMESIFC